MKNSYTQQASAFKQRVIDRIKKKVLKSENESKFSNDRAIFVSEKCGFNLDGGRWLEEITEKGLIDNYGYQYNYEVLTKDQLCELADEIFVAKWLLNATL